MFIFIPTVLNKLITLLNPCKIRFSCYPRREQRLAALSLTYTAAGQIIKIQMVVLTSPDREGNRSVSGCYTGYLSGYSNGPQCPKLH